MSKLEVIKTKDFEEKVLKSKIPVVVDFYADWCGPCKVLTPTLEKVSESLGGRSQIVKLNVDESPEIAEKFGVRSIPTLLFFKDGELRGTLVGNQPQAAIVSELERSSL